ncbi:MAG: Asp-tRNA(Asn)/Glu-tRNA(Gln) amidotransferase subunit GatB [Phycisphaerales bacterium]|nr:Asp-tRNA(Asn)/Glu-tRNA(Gln) amidotransferase subunit GatB [Phycisphaerales bacterium]
MLEIHGLRCDPIIGLEIHVQLATRTKMWCGCTLAFGAEPNTHVCPVCLGLPGALPVANQRAVELAVRTSIALGCHIAQFTQWDRKSYYYPDLPKNYQISQYDHPLAERGVFEFPSDGGFARVRIRRAHLEEDAGKNVHDFPGYTGVDLNRAGTPLLEVVTEPDLRSADEAREFAVQLHRLVRYLGVSEANMQQGQMRFEPNINLRIHRDGQVYVTPIVEVKNLNSFKSLHGAIAYEIPRQVEEWLETGAVARSGNKGNRGWDDQREITVVQREKEEAHDYRYFPDPDLVPVTHEPAWIDALRNEMPELPVPRAARFVHGFRLPERDAPALVDDRATADLLDEAAEAGGDQVTLGKHFLSFWQRYANERQTTIAGLGVAAPRLAELANLVVAGEINATAAVQIAGEMLTDSAPPRAIAERLGLLQIRDSDQIARWVAEVLVNHAQAVRDAVANPKKLKAARGFLLGQVMKLSGGTADPELAGRLIDEQLARAT